jgi:hypothetical protein
MEVFKAHPETLFVLRAHPDEARPGKLSRESVAMWFEQQAAAINNAVFIPPQERISSYELVRLSKFVLTYNSQIGLESVLMGVPALGAARAPFVDYGTIYFEHDRETYQQRLESFLEATRLEVPEEAVRNTRRFIYFRYYRFSLPFGQFVESIPPTGYVHLKKFSWKSLEKSSTAHAMVNGILGDGDFSLQE